MQHSKDTYESRLYKKLNRAFTNVARLENSCRGTRSKRRNNKSSYWGCVGVDILEKLKKLQTPGNFPQLSPLSPNGGLL